jgi:hypothetical protein
MIYAEKNRFLIASNNRFAKWLKASSLSRISLFRNNYASRNYSKFKTALIVLTADVIKASMAFPSQTEQFVVNYFNQHFGFVYSKKRMEQLQNHLSVNTSSYTKISCTQLKSLATEDSIDEMIRFLIDVAVSDDFINAKEIKGVAANRQIFRRTQCNHGIVLEYG